MYRSVMKTVSGPSQLCCVKVNQTMNVNVISVMAYCVTSFRIIYTDLTLTLTP